LSVAQEREWLLWLAKTANDAKSKETNEGKGARESEGGKRKWQPSHELLDEEVGVLCARARA